MKKKNILKVMVFGLLAGTISVSLGHFAVAKAGKEQKIYAGVYLDGAYVGGLTKDEAMEKYAEYTEGIEDLELTFKTAAGSYSTTLEEIDFSFSVEGAVEQALNYGRQGNILTRYKEIKGLEEENVVLIPEKSFDKDKLTDKLTNETTDIVQEPENASIKRQDGKFTVYEGKVGQQIVVDKTVKAVEELFKKEWEQKNITLDAVVNEKQPEYTAEDFYAVDSVLGQFETEYNAGNGSRSQNLVTGAGKISGTVLMPGEQFSMYNTVAPFTEENGYANAGQYVNNELVDGLGGGICQVSTTLYNAVLFAELEVDERYPHSLSVGYVKLSRDAAIAGDYMDFKFTNNTEYPIYIDGYAGGGKISFAVYGHETRPDNRTIDFETKVISTKKPGKPEKVEDDTLEKGEEKIEQEAHTGYYTELWKNIYIDGVLEDSVRVNQSQYQAKKAKILIGTKEPEKKDKDKNKNKDKDKKDDSTSQETPSEDVSLPPETSEEETSAEPEGEE